MKCTVYELAIMGSNPSLVELGVRGISKLYLNQIYLDVMLWGA